MKIDLHTHSTVSDGQYTPTELIRLAKHANLEVIALTDHDTVDGIKEAREAAGQLGQPFIAGIEISTRKEEEIHMVGLGIDEDYPALLAETKKLMEDRANRGVVITEYLRELGISVDYEEVKAMAGEGSVGRPHFAQYLQKHGYVRSRQEAFDRYLNTPSFHKVTDRILPPPEEAIELIHLSGGKAVLAHPGLLKMGKSRQEDFICRLKKCGLDAIEAYYSKYSKAQEKYYRDLAKRYDLKISVGSDFHGEKVKPDVKLGMEPEELQIIDRLVLAELYK